MISATINSSGHDIILWWKEDNYGEAFLPIETEFLTRSNATGHDITSKLEIYLGFGEKVFLRSGGVGEVGEHFFAQLCA